ncbi:MAG: hypothetical protein AAF901_06990 [Bacteroidota bacterium]
MNNITNLLQIEAEEGISAKTVDSVHLRAHFLLGEHCGDIPECKDMLGIKYSHVTAKPCFRCCVPSGQLKLYQQNDHRSLEMTEQIFREYESKKERHGRTVAIKVMDDESMVPVRPALSDFPFVGITPVLDIYNIYSVEPMHLFHLGISKMLKICATDRLKSLALETYNMTKNRGYSIPFQSIRTVVIKQLNYFIEEVCNNADTMRIEGNFRRDDGKSGLNGLFKDEGLVGMIEAKAMKNIDKVSPFLGAIIDRCCNEEEKSPVTRVFTHYVELMKLCCGYGPEVTWNDEKFGRLTEKIKEFKKEGVEVFGESQKSGMGTLKWHLLDHIRYVLERLGGLRFCDASLFEYTHKLFKILYGLTSMRKTTSFQETVDNINKNMDNQIVSNKKKRVRCHEEEDRDSAKWTRKEKGNVVRHFLKCCLLDFLVHIQQQNAIQEMKHFKHQAISRDIPEKVKQFLKNTGQEATEIIARLLCEVLKSDIEDSTLLKNIELKFSKSYYVRGRYAPTLDNQTSINGEGKVYVDSTAQRKMQRVVASQNFYGKDNMRYDNVILAADQGGKEQTDGKMELWFAKVLGFINLESKGVIRPGTNTCMIHNRDDCKTCHPDYVNQYAFVKYYDVLSEESVPIDEIDKCLNCIRLCWSKSNPVQKDRDSGKVYGLCPVDSIEGRIHVVEFSGMLELIDGSNTYKEKVIQKVGPEKRWEGKTFYVNIFIRSKSFNFYS